MKIIRTCEQRRSSDDMRLVYTAIYSCNLMNAFIIIEGDFMQIDEKLISYLEDLSYLTLSADEKKRLTGDLEEILSYMAHLSELDTNGVPERSHPFDNVNAFREDEVLESFDRELILKNAPNSNGEAFIAPKTI